jgi:hypothetical protein
MMRVFICAALFSVVLGCGGAERPYTDNSKDATAFATSVKQVVLSAVEELKTSKQPADTLNTIVLMLGELDVAPTGEYLGTYQQLHSVASDLLSKSESGRPSDMQSKLGEITKLANSLPGDVVIQKDSHVDL